MWVEIYERGERMFANLGTGQCQWEAPIGEPIKQANLSQWWELFDHSTGRFYYYNAFKMTTVWHRPLDADIIPLARFQQRQRRARQDSQISNSKSTTSANNDATSTASNNTSTRQLLNASSAGHSMSSREDLIEEMNEEETENEDVISESTIANSACTTPRRTPGVGAESSPESSPVKTLNNSRLITREKSKSVATPTKSPADKKIRRSLSAASAKIPKSNFGEACSGAFLLNRGFMKKPMLVSELLTFQKKQLKRPLTNGSSKILMKEFGESFRLVNSYLENEKMCDLVSLISFGWNHSEIANEIYPSIIKQSRHNPNDRSLQVALELTAICLYFFAPSNKNVQNLIKEWLNLHERDHKPFYQSCLSRLKKVVEKGNRRGLIDPGEPEILLAKRHIYQKSMFGTTLEDILATQNEQFPELEIPWIQRELTSVIIRLGGLSTEGIFRLPGEIDRVNALRVDVEDYHVRNADDPHVACSLLKLWLREMAKPIFPEELTEEILNTSENKEESLEIISKLSDLTKTCLTHLIRFLQVFAKEKVSQKTRMDSANLAMVMAPNLFRPMSDDPRLLLDNSRREINFLRNLIDGMDTSSASEYDSCFTVEKV